MYMYIAPSIRSITGESISAVDGVDETGTDKHQFYQNMLVRLDTIETIYMYFAVLMFCNRIKYMTCYRATQIKNTRKHMT